MKKLRATRTANKLKSFRFSFLRVFSVATVTAFLSNISPVFSANPDFRNTFFEGVNSAVVSYPQSIISVAGLNTSSDKSTADYLTVLNAAGAEKINASEDYASFLTSTLLGMSDKNSVTDILTKDSNKLSKNTLSIEDHEGSLISPRLFARDNSSAQQVAQNDENRGAIDVSDFSQSAPIARMQRAINPGMQRALKETGNSVMVGNQILGDKASESVVIGYGADVRPETYPTDHIIEGVIIGYKAASANGGAVVVGAQSKAFTAGVGSVIVGRKAKSSGMFAIAIGGFGPLDGTANDPPAPYGTITDGDFSIALGYTASVTKEGENSIVIGHDAKASAKNAIALGYGTKVSGEDAIALGLSAEASGNNAIALGYGTKANSDFAMTLGWNAEASRDYALALGAFARASNENALAFGPFSVASAQNTIALGWNTEAKGNYTLALGSGAKASAEYGIALGSDSTADVAAGVLGYDPSAKADSDKRDGKAWKSTLGAVSIGNVADGKTRQIVGVAAGTQDTDAVNVAQLKAVQEAAATTGGIKGLQINTIGVGFGDAIAAAKDSIALGGSATVTENAQASIAIGGFAKASDESAVALGFRAGAGAYSSIAIGNLANVAASSGIAIGNQAQVENGAAAGEAIALGFRTRARVEGGVALGSDSTAYVAAGVSGYDPSTKAQSAQNNMVWKSGYGAVSVGDFVSSKTRQIVGVAAGTNDTDAVNVAQLKKLRKFVDQGWNLSVGGENTKVVAIGETVDLASGSKNFEITKGKDDNKIKFDLAKNITLESVTAGKNIFDATGLKIAGGPQITTGGIDAGSKKITNVATGTADTDAVNVAQLKALQNSAGANWDLTVDGKDKTSVNSTSPMDLAAGSTNLKITKGKDDNNVKFDLAKDITLDSVTAGKNIFDTTGLIIANGPKMTTGGIDAGGKKITGVSEGTGGTDAVNFSQLQKVEKDVKEQVAASSFVKQDSKTKHITIGKDTDGDKIDIANNANENRTLTGIKAGALSAGSNEAVIGSQLFETNKNVTNVATNIAKFFGGGAKYEDGKWTTPSFIIKQIGKDGTSQDKTYQDVATAFTGIDNSFTNVVNNFDDKLTKTTEEINNNITNIKQEVQGDALLWDKEKKAFAAQHGDKKTNSKLTSLANGEISATSSDAVAGNQLQTLGSSVAQYFGGGAGYEKGTWKAPSFIVKSFKEDGSVTDTPYDNVASAFAGVGNSFEKVNNRFENIKNEITQEITNEITTVQGDSLLWNKEANAFVAQHGEKEGKKTNSKIKYLANGEISATSSDAVAGNQLQALGSSVAQYFGGGASYENGTWKAPSFIVKSFKEDGSVTDTPYGDVASAFAGVGNSFEKVNNKFENIKNEITKEVTEEITTVQGDALLWNKEANAFVAQHGEKEGKKTNSKIKYLANGEISTTSSDAVAGNQLHALGSSVAKSLGGGAGYKDGAWSGPTFKFKTVNTDGKEEDKTYPNVAAAFEGVGTSFTNIVSKIDKKITDITETFQSDVLLWDGAKAAFVAEHGKEGSSKITSLANGEISGISSDAVAGKQLYGLGSGVAKSLGGNAGYENGSWRAPTFIVKSFKEDGGVTETPYGDVASAFAGVGDSFEKVNNKFENIKNEITQEITEEITTVQGDSLLWNKEANAFVAKHGEKEGEKTNSKITSLANGNINSSSSDAVAGNQLYTLGSSVAKSLGGNASYENGVWNAPSFKFNTIKDNGESGEQEYKNVAEALTEVGNSFTNIKNEITKQVNNLQSDDSAVVHYDKNKKGEIDYTSVTLGGKGKAPTALHNVADGQIAENSHDAVTGGQLNKIGSDVSKFLGGGSSFKGGTLTEPSYQLSSIAKDGKVTDRSFGGVGTAFSGLDENIKNVNDRIKEVSQGVVQDALLWNKETKAFVAQHGDKEENSKITSLKGGIISRLSTDAINGSQLYALGSSVSQYFGGGASYENGAWSAPNFIIKQIGEDGTSQDETYQDVATAFTGIGSSFTNVVKNFDDKVKDVKKDFNDKIERITQEVQQEVQDDALLWDKKANAFVAQHGAEGKEKTKSKITSLANGEINSSSSDAVNGSQLYTLGSSVAKSLGGNASYENGKWSGPTFTVKSFKEDGSVTDSTYGDVASAFAGVGDSFGKVKDKFENVKSEITKEITKEINTVQGDALLWDKKANAFVAKHGEKEGEKTASKITSLANGNINSSSSDAVNGSQLYTLGSSVAKSLGGNASYENGVWTDPSFTVKTVNGDGEEKAETYKNVADAFSGVGSSITNVKNEITKQINNEIANVKGDSLVQKDAESHRITIGSKVEGSEINVANSKGSDRTLSGVKEATKSNEAVNKGQFDKSLKELSDSLQSDDSAVVHYDKNKKGEIDYTSVTLGGKGKAPTALHNVADGQIAENSHDAVTGGQINKIGSDVSKFLGGGSSFKGGTLTEPSYQLSSIAKDGKVTDRSFGGVGTAFSGLDENIKNVNDRIKEVSQGVAQDALLWNKETKAFVAQHGDKEENSKITSLKGGIISRLSTDAINGSQLYALGSSVSQYFGGGASYENGAWSAPNFKVKTVNEDGVTIEDKEYGTVSEAFTGVGSSFEKLQKEFNQSITNIKQEVQGDALLWSKADGAFIAQHGEEDKEKVASKIKYLAGGEISATSTEAINGSQLYETNDKVATYLGGGAGYKDGKWTDPSFTVKTVDGDGEEKAETYKNVADAFSGVGSSITNVKNEITKQINNEIANVKGDSLVQKDAESHRITIGSKVEGSEINVANSKGSDRTLSGVKEATKSNEAVNKGQFDKGLKELSDNLQSDDSAVVHYNKTEKGETDYKNVTFGGKDKTPVGLHNIADGQIAENSRDAVTGGQINKIGSDVAKFLGGGTSFKDGSFTGPSYKISGVDAKGEVVEKTYDDVGLAFAGIDTNFKNVNENVTNKFNELTQNITNITQEVQGDALLWDKTKGAFVAEHGEKEGSKTNSKITSLANGDISATSSDAVAGNQLYSLGSGVAKSLGGGASYENGAWSAPNFKVKTVNEDGVTIEDKEYGTVSEAFTGVGSSFEKLQKEFNQSISNIKQEVQGDALLWSKADEAFIAKHGEEGKEKTASKIKYLAGGEISAASTEAINGSQLYSLGNNVAQYFGGGTEYKDGKWSAPSFKVKTVKDNGESEEQEYKNVAEALTGVGTSFTNIKNEITNQINHLQSDDSAVVHYNKTEKGEIDYKNVTFGKGKDSTAVGLHNVADGKIAKDSRDAINGGQINTIGEDIAKFLGGEAAFKDGSLTQPTYKLSQVDANGKVNSTEFKDVGAAFTGLDENIKNVNDRIKEVSQGVAQDSLSWSKDDNAFSAQHGEKEKTNSKIKYLANGDISAASTEAINGSQLYETNDKVANYLGGGAGYKDGKWTDPSFTVKTVNGDGEEKAETYKNVGDALTGVGSSITNVKNEITKQINNEIANVKGDSLVQKDAESHRITIGSKVEGSEINIANNSGSDRTLSGVKEATKSNEAVNKGQFDKSLKELSDSFQSDDSAVVHYNKNEKGDVDYTSVTLGKGKNSTAVGLHNVADGKIADKSHDAITGGQVNKISQDVAKYLGGGTSFKEGSFTGPTYKLSQVDEKGEAQQAEFKDVGSAFSGLDKNIKNVNDRIKEVSQGVAQDSLSWSKDDNAFSAQHGEKKTNSKITSLANGEINSSSSDAVAGNQLYTLGSSVAKSLGGNASYENGIWNAPSFKVKTVKDNGESEEQEYKNVAEALTGVGTSFTNIKNEISNQINHLQSDDSAVIHYDKKEKDEIDYQNVTFGKGKDSTAVGLHNVADGKIAENSHDAITGGQVNKISQDVAKYLGGGTSFKDGGFTGPSYKISSVDAKGEVVEKTYDDVGLAFAGIDTNFKNVNDNVTNKFNELTHNITNITQELQGDALLWSKADGAFIAQHGEEDKEKTASKIKYLAGGEISATSTEAINGAQLYETNDKVATYLGGGAGYKDGKWTDPSFTVKTVKDNGESEEQEYKNVAEALTGVGTSFTNIKNEISNQINHLQS
ncbi:hypothetical protein, partial [Bartonella tribocorum]|uniref:hypothetical protein n=1 Tax=Bartonella tribocorum TaxID=85701 RepID=UPI001ABA2DA3